MIAWAAALVVLEAAAAPATAPSLCAVALGTELGAFRLLDGAVLLTAGGPAALCAADRPCAALADDPARGARGLAPAEDGRVTSAAGRWGQHLALTRALRRGEGELHEVLELDGGRWRARRDAERGWLPWYPRLAAAGGRIVGIAELEADGAHATGKQLLAPQPRPRVSTLDRARARALMAFAVNEEPVDLLPLADGTTLVLANRVDRGAGVAVVHRLPARGAAPSLAERLPSPCAGAPDADTDAYKIDGRRGDDVYVALAARCGTRRVTALARFDGRRWAVVPGPDNARPVEDLSVSDAGTIWLTAGGVLYRRAPRGDWATVALVPPPEAGAACVARQAIARGDDGVLVLAVCGAAKTSAPPARVGVPSFVFEAPCRVAPLLRVGGGPDAAR